MATTGSVERLELLDAETNKTYVMYIDVQDTDKAHNGASSDQFVPLTTCPSPLASNHHSPKASISHVISNVAIDEQDGDNINGSDYNELNKSSNKEGKTPLLKRYSFFATTVAVKLVRMEYNATNVALYSTYT
ncbi:hypothetical protein EAI_05987 [Harpegnathos saltator]|uniref:Uncharacterized protein n=1 Tax=Harpegnathos saltator TaxID=610380 RepID=E2BM71_HARSA|nr:hypothetical protein EAI_05987 [Harpegnathos saltator]